MELDFYDNVNNDYPDDCIFCLKNFTKDELIILSMEIDKIIKNNVKINLSELHYINNISKNELMLKLGTVDKGIIKVKDNQYECVLTKVQYLEMKEMLLHYEITNIGTHYYWLCDTISEIDFLLSYDGNW